MRFVPVSSILAPVDASLGVRTRKLISRGHAFPFFVLFVVVAPPRLILFCSGKQNHSQAVYDAATMPTRVLFDEAMEPVKKDFPMNYAYFMKQPLEEWTHHATPSENVTLKMSTSNSAESTIAAVGAEVGE